MKLLTLLTVLAAATPTVARAEVWLGGFAGVLSGTAGSTVTPLGMGAGIGVRSGNFGGELQYVQGSKSTSLLGVDIDSSVDVITGRFDIFALGRFFYIGPQVSYTTVKVGAQVAGLSATTKLSGLLYGGGAGFNIPMGRVSLGIDGSYVTGSLKGTSASGYTALGSLKFWF
jgi:hypothetical protein